ncbi:MAG: cell division protein FtsA [Candidatus Dependentiae bacterium]|nr:cell division protein FtsA [Candidatus Dependentiae bacterium]
MAKVFSDHVVVSIDIGTTKICVLVAQRLPNDQLEILGVGKSPSDGLKKGVVVDVAKTIHSIKLAVKEAELMAGLTIETVCIGVSGGHIQSLSSQGMVPIKKGEVRVSDIEAALDAAKAIPVPEGMQILHVLPQYFVIDGHAHLNDPLGMHGIRLEVQAHIILGAISSVQNLVKCCEMAGLKVNDIILEQLASADAVLSPDERELGVAVLDIGGGTSDLAIYQCGSIRHTMVLPVAGNHFTNDIAIGLRTTLQDAERVKKEYGFASMELLEEDTIFEVDSVHGHDTTIVQATDLVRIINPRAQEILVLVHDEIIKRKLQAFIPTGLVLTGGGSLLRGMKELGQAIFNVPVRIGSPRLSHDMPESLNSPMYATAYGLLINTLKKSERASMDSMSGPLVSRVLTRMKSWVSDFF